MTDTIPRKQTPKRLGGGWFHATDLLEGETVEMEAEVLHKPSKSKQGGKLYLTDKRLVYLPDRWAAVVGDSSVEWPLDQITEVGMTREPDAAPIFRIAYLMVFECMYVERSGDRHLFSTRLPMVDREWVAAIKAAQGGAAPSPEPANEEAAAEVPAAPPEEPAEEGQAPAQAEPEPPADA